MKTEKTRNLYLLAIAFVILSIIKHIEFIYIRTDQTVIAENIFTKIFCIIAVLVLLFIEKKKLGDIGFKKQNILKYMAYGLGLGAFTFAISYGIEMLILSAQGKAPGLAVYITNFGLTGATNQNSLSFMAVIICIAGNIVNVLAEEGFFRGIMLKNVSESFGFKTGNFIQAFLFGEWHIVTVVLLLHDGEINIPTAIVFAIGYVVLAGILALEWGTCFSMTGVLWVGIFEHFFNNCIGNMLHVVSSTGVDEMQIVRIVFSNLLSLGIVLAINRKKKKN